MRSSWLLIGLLALSFADRASACECVVVPSVHDAFNQAGLVVEARVLSVSKEPDYIERAGLKTRVEAEIVEWIVIKSWKGPYAKDQTFTTKSHVTCCLCGRSVSVGSSLLLYLDGIQPYSLSSCGRTAVLKGALGDIPELSKLSSTLRANGT